MGLFAVPSLSLNHENLQEIIDDRIKTLKVNIKLYEENKNCTYLLSFARQCIEEAVEVNKKMVEDRRKKV